MEIFVFDESLEISGRARQILSPTGARVRFVGSLAEVELAVTANVRPDLLIVNVWGELTAWRLAAWIHRTSFEGRTLALVSSLADPGVTALRHLPGVECAVRPASTARLGALLQRAGTPVPVGRFASGREATWHRAEAHRGQNGAPGEGRHAGGAAEAPDPDAEVLTLREVERRHILYVLGRARGNRTQAARLLGMSLRGLQYRLKAYGPIDLVGEAFTKSARRALGDRKDLSEVTV
jgi:Bacterial regulatory protein, Fis family